jgi:long-chain acyl-CoA synthetase
MVHEEKEITKTNAKGEKYKEMKKWTYYVLGAYEWISYEQFLDKVKRVGSGLRELGVGEEGETMFNIYASTA